MSAGFVHLRVHTEYSLGDSIVRIPQLMDRVAELGMPAVGVADAGNLFALVKVYRAAEARGIKPVIGADINLAVTPGEEPGRITLLACGREGYRQLSEVITRSFIEGQHAGRPLVQGDWLKGHSDALIALAGRLSPLGRTLLSGDTKQSRARFDMLSRLFPHGFYLELTRTGQAADEEDFNQAALGLCMETATPAVATNDVCFLTPEDYEAHEARVALDQMLALP